jgi:hypothetical protein
MPPVLLRGLWPVWLKAGFLGAQVSPWPQKARRRPFPESARGPGPLFSTDPAGSGFLAEELTRRARDVWSFAQFRGQRAGATIVATDSLPIFAIDAGVLHWGDAFERVERSLDGCRIVRAAVLCLDGDPVERNPSSAAAEALGDAERFQYEEPGEKAD